MTPAPRASGARSTYAAVPARVRGWVEEQLGSPVVATQEQVGGFSPGCATRVTCADGTRAFVKAVGRELDPDTPTLFRREVELLTLLGSHPLWADLLGSRDDGDWVALLLEDVDGALPDLDDDEVMEQLLRSTDQLGAELRSRLPVLPAVQQPGTGPAFLRPGLVDVHQVLTDWVPSFDALLALPDPPVPRWLVDEAHALREGVTALADDPTRQPVHHDIRNDNLLRRPTGEIVFVDWGGAGTGPDWLDPLLARLERVGSPWFDASLASSPALARAGDEVVTSWLVGMGAHLAWRAHSASHTELPALRAFRRAESARLLGAAARRLGVGPSI